MFNFGEGPWFGVHLFIVMYIYVVDRNSDCNFASIHKDFRFRIEAVIRDICQDVLLAARTT